MRQHEEGLIRRSEIRGKVEEINRLKALISTTAFNGMAASQQHEYTSALASFEHDVKEYFEDAHARVIRR